MIQGTVTAYCTYCCVWENHDYNSWSAYRCWNCGGPMVVHKHQMYKYQDWKNALELKFDDENLDRPNHV